MCGIAGWLSTAPLAFAQITKALSRMLTSIQHRGPDGEGQWCGDHAAFGHRRLAIIDVEHGNQPMVLTSPDLALTFNGEIYNYQTIRNELVAGGYHFLTHSDTEVILQLYRSDGIKGFNRLRGMFAFALWDDAKKIGLLARDSLGIKPLFFRQNRNTLVFASEAKAILAQSQERGKLNSDALHLLLNFRYLPGNRSLFDGIQQLPAGKIMIWNTDGYIRYADIALPSAAMDPLSALRDSVRHHLVADVPIGAYLSGGIDSAAITKLAVEMSGQPLSTFTLAVGDDPMEADNAASSANIIGVANIQRSISSNCHADLQALIWHLETPKINALQNSMLAKLAAQYVKVSLSGLGGDELFLGYNAHKIFYYASQVQRFMPSGRQKIIAKTLANISAFISKPLVFTENTRSLNMLAHLGEWPVVYGLLRNIWDTPSLRHSIYGPRLLDQPLTNAYEEIESLWPQDCTPMEAIRQFEWRQKMINDLLWNEDRVSMAEGLEVRMPFVDIYLHQAVQSLSIAQLMPNGKLKHYLKACLQPILPTTILQRQKSGFQVNANDFYQQELKSLSDIYLSYESVTKVGLFNYDFIAAIKGAKPSQKLRWHYFMLYLMIGVMIWIEQFEV